MILLFSILFLSFIFSTSVSALSHRIDSIPIYFPSSQYQFPNYYQSSEGFVIEVSDEITYSDFLFNPYVLSYYKDSETNRCKHLSPISQSYHRLLYSINTHKFGYAYTGQFNPDPSSFLYCLKVSGFNGDSYDSYSIVDFPTNHPLVSELNSILPYRSTTSAFYISDPVNNPQTGVKHGNKFDFINSLFKDDHHPEEIKSLQIPIGSSNDISFTNGQSLQFRGRFSIYLDADPNDVDFGLETTATLETRMVSQNGFRRYTTDCLTTLNPMTGEDSLPTDYTLTYACYYTMPQPYVSSNVPSFNPETEYPWWRLNLSFNYTGQDKKFYMFVYESSYLITDYDSTTGQKFSQPVVGSDPHSAPGGYSQFGDPFESDSDDNWFTQLTNLFNFNFFNPFAPMFALFTDGSSCVSIPTIASMLHSEETTYCPWFDSTVRNILTPVVGLSSTMLLFGFLVHWLGARSGNFIEDTNGGTIGSVKIGKRGKK